MMSMIIIILIIIKKKLKMMTIMILISLMIYFPRFSRYHARRLYGAGSGACDACQNEKEIIGRKENEEGK
jgi:hypothetical protein